MAELDDLDLAILAELQENIRTGAEAIADSVGSSPASVHRRLKRLRDAGVIEGEVAILNDKALGFGMTVLVSVEVERERADLLDQFRARMRAFPEVQQCYYVMGDADFVLVVKARDIDDYERFTKEAFFDNSNVRKFQSTVVMSEVKKSLRLPIG